MFCFFFFWFILDFILYFKFYRLIFLFLGMMETLFGTNLGFYKSNDFQTNVEAQRMLQSFIEASNALVNCESGLQLWRFYDTHSWNKLSSSCEILERYKIFRFNVLYFNG